MTSYTIIILQYWNNAQVILLQMLVRYCSLPIFGNFYVLCSTVFAVDTWTRYCTSRKLWILWRKWRHIGTTVRRKLKVWKVRNQVCTGLWPRRIRRCFFITANTGVPMHWVSTCFVGNQLGAFFRCSLCITLPRHHAQLLCRLTNELRQRICSGALLIISRHWNSQTSSIKFKYKHDV